MAAIALVGLRYLEEDNGRRRELADLYDRQLAGNPRVWRGWRPGRS